MNNFKKTHFSDWYVCENLLRLSTEELMLLNCGAGEDS